MANFVGSFGRRKNDILLEAWALVFIEFQTLTPPVKANLRLFPPFDSLRSSVPRKPWDSKATLASMSSELFKQQRKKGDVFAKFSHFLKRTFGLHISLPNAFNGRKLFAFEWDFLPLDDELRSHWATSWQMRLYRDFKRRVRKTLLYARWATPRYRDESLMAFIINCGSKTEETEAEEAHFRPDNIFN